MALVLGPTGNLLYAPGGLANSTKCCCCEEECTECACCACWECSDGVKYALPTNGCHNASGRYCLTATLSGLTFSTACRTYRDANCNAVDGTFDAYKLLASSLPSDLVIPLNYNDATPITDIRDPDSVCNNIANVCKQWKTCVTLQDTGIDFQQWTNANCTGSSNTANLTIAAAVLDYQVVSPSTRRFVLWVAVAVGSSIPIPIFFGVVNFDARQCSNYSAWPLTINNGISGTSCVCGASGAGFHPIATGGTATLTLACDTPLCSGAEGLMGMSTERLRGDEAGAAAAIAALDGPPIAEHRLIDAAAQEEAERLETKKKKKRCCSG